MSKPVYEVETTCADGINDSVNGARKNQCADAMNVWAPDGHVVERPGFIGYVAVPLLATASANIALVSEDVSTSTFITAPRPGTLTLSNFVARTVAGGAVTVLPDRWYLGYNSPFAGFLVVLAAPNSNAVQFEAEYWNGSAWVSLPNVSEMSTSATFTQLVNVGVHLSSALGSATIITQVLFVPRADWAPTTVNGVASKYWVRFVLVNNGAGALDAATVIDNGTAAFPFVFAASTDEVFLHCVLQAKFPSSTSYLILLSTPASATSSSTPVVISDSLLPTNVVAYTYRTKTTRDLAATMAVISEVGEAYAAHNRKVILARQAPGVGDNLVAAVEDRDFAIGPGAPWDRRTVAMLGDFPDAKFIMYFQSRLWVVDGGDFLRWSAKTPYHRVWPALAFERLAEDDNSPVTGMAALQEFAVITKTDSIWVAAFDNFDVFNIPHYSVRKIVAGSGCVANGSIQKVMGDLVMLGEEDILAFDGTSIHSITEDSESGSKRISGILRRITPGARAWSASAHWKSRKVYLLSVPLDGADRNTHTIVWDYKRNNFWLWDIAADFWVVDEGPFDEEQVYFATVGGFIYRLSGSDDNGVPFEAHVTTRRLGWTDGLKKALTSLEVNSRNTSEAVTLDVYRNGSDKSSGTKHISLHNPGQHDWGTAKWGVDEWAESFESHHFTRAMRVGNAHHVQVRLAKDGGPFVLYGLSAGFTPFRGRQ